MRRLWSSVIVAVLALLMLSTAFVDAGGKRSATITDGWAGTSDCDLSFSLTWANYGGKPGTTYTAVIAVWIDSELISSLTTPPSAGTGSLTHTENLDAPDATLRTIEVFFTLTKNGDRPHLVFEQSVTHQTNCRPS